MYANGLPKVPPPWSYFRCNVQMQSEANKPDDENQRAWSLKIFDGSAAFVHTAIGVTGADGLTGGSHHLTINFEPARVTGMIGLRGQKGLATRK
jgi:hypothetical protein